MYSDLIDRTTGTALCLACSSSLLPLKGTVASLANPNSIHITNCCQRPICPTCISSNPRLARYNPCLACLAGVDLVGLGSANKFGSKGKTPASPNFGSDCNVDGSTRDQDTFVLGDDDDDEWPSTEQVNESQIHNTPPPVYEEINVVSPRREHGESSDILTDAAPYIKASLEDQRTTIDVEPCMTDNASRTEYKYYLNRRDTLQGICLRFGINGHEICKLNNLPLSVIHTTPHLLHTRAFLLIPASAKLHPSLTLSTTEENSREEKLVRERAEKKLQTLTKEVDWRVAKVYVALADDGQEQETFAAKRKEIGVSGSNSSGGSAYTVRGLEALAIERYLDDEEWEAEQIRAGRAPQISPFPMKGRSSTQKATGNWWYFKK